jgi:hypothetical protein
MINVRDYGARGKGVADDTAAHRHALDHSDGAVYFPAGTYRVTGPLTVPRNTHVVGDGVEATTVTARGCGADQFQGYQSVFRFTGGSFVPLKPLAADVRRFAVTLPVASAEGIRTNDVLVLSDPTPRSYSAFNPIFNAGEFVQVNEVGEREVRIVGSLQADYRRDRTLLFRMEKPTRSTLARLTVVGTDRATDHNQCVRFECGRGVALRDVRLAQAHYALCAFVQCFGAQAENVEGEQIFPVATREGLNYGIAVGNSQDVRVVNCRVVAMRHAITIGGAPFGKNSPNPVNRHVSVVNCDLKGTCDIEALDAHGNTEFYVFENNRVAGGIDFAGAYGRIVGNDLYGRDDNQAGIGLYGTDLKGTEFEIRNNRIHTRATESFSGRGAIYLLLDRETVAAGPLVVAGNRVEVAGDVGDCRGLRLLNRGCPAAGVVVRVEDNDFGAETFGHHLVFERRPGTVPPIEALIVRHNTFRNGDVVLRPEDTKQVVFRGNWPLADR